MRFLQAQYWLAISINLSTVILLFPLYLLYLAYTSLFLLKKSQYNLTMNFQRDQDGLDRFLVQFDRAVVTLFGCVPESRPVPLPQVVETQQEASISHSTRQDNVALLGADALTADQMQHSARLMRVNHAGEVCAQALYYGQACTTQSHTIQALLLQAAREEADHLAWCQKRLSQLNSHPSYLGPVWYTGSFCLGLFAGWMGVKWGLGFVQETEKQVAAHLDHHMTLLPKQDRESRAILEQMRVEEITHAQQADLHGAVPLPAWVCTCMHYVGKSMTLFAKWV